MQSCVNGCGAVYSLIQSGDQCHLILRHIVCSGIVQVASTSDYSSENTAFVLLSSKASHHGQPPRQ